MATAPVDIPVLVKGLADLQKLEKRMQALEKSVGKINKSLPQANNTIKKTGRAAATATGNIQRFGVAFRSTLGPIVATYGAVRILNGSLKVLGEREADVAALSNGLQKLGKGVPVLNKLQKQADEFGNSTLFNQEDFTKGATLLTSFTNIAVRDYNRIINVAGDLAQTNGVAVKDSLLQLAKALNAPTQNLTALSRSGIQFTEQQKEQIKTLERNGKLLQAQSIVLRELTRQYGGNAKAAATGFAGAVDTLGENLRDFQQVLGTGIEPISQGFVSTLSDLFAILKQIDPKVVQVTASIAAMTAGAVALKAAFAALAGTKLAAFFAPIVAQLNLGNIAFAAFIAKTKLATVAIAGLKLALASLGVGLAALAIGALVNKVLEWTGATKNQNLEQEKLNQTQKRFNNIIASGSVPAINKEIGLIREKIRSAIAEGKEIDDLTDKTADLVAERKRLIDLERTLRKINATEGLQKANSATKIALKTEEQLLQNREKLASAQFTAQSKLLDLQKQRAQQAGKIIAVYQIEVQQANLAYQQALAQIQAETQKAALKVKQVQLATQELKVQLLIKKAKGDLEYADKLAYQEQLKAVQLAKQNLAAVKEIGAEQTKGAAAVRVASIEAARYAASQSLTARAAERTAAAQQKGAAALSKAASSARSVASASARIGGGFQVGGTSNLAVNALARRTQSSIIFGRGSQEAYNAGVKVQTEALRRLSMRNAYNTYKSQASALRSVGIYAPSNPYRGYQTGAFPRQFAEGGYVSKPTNATIAEAGEPEYVIPASKMDSAIKRYAKGARGEAVTEGGGSKNSKGNKGSVVNVSTGPVMRMDNKDYVTISDLNSALGSVVSAMDGDGGNFEGSARVG